MTQPNLIYVFADQLRYQSLGYAGDISALTPNIDILPGASVNFFNCVSGSPMCAPYRASLFTGKYSSSTGMVINELRINPDQRCSGTYCTIPATIPITSANGIYGRISWANMKIRRTRLRRRDPIASALTVIGRRTVFIIDIGTSIITRTVPSA